MSVEATLATWNIQKSRITATEKLFLLSCADRAGEGGICWPSIKRLCADTCLDRKTLISVRQSVMDKDLLIYTGELKGKTKSIPVMKLTYVKERYKDDELNSPEIGTAPNTSSTDNGIAKQSRNWDTESKRSLNLKEDLITPISPKNKNDSFEEFWEAYPIKKSKKACEEKWKRKNLDKIAEEILPKLNVQICNDRSWLAGFIPNPLTYINQEKWEDDVDLRTVGNTSAKQSTNDFNQTMAKYNTPKRGYYDENGNFTECYL